MTAPPDPRVVAVLSECNCTGSEYAGYICPACRYGPALLAALKAERVRALEEARDETCSRCRGGYGFEDDKPNLHVDHGRHVGRCNAVKIRDLIAAEEKA